ncbi:hypothetical protein SAMN05444159_5052 [Bradyrhizobium lablabi]|uniref:Uncharacterized protein n=2 Tax=Bradyrhizobium lablabi TaxID=722472 RepID=A0A1M6Y297_9BRAD|nr:hypothetical protein SAMN05444159_5052 [Bradyrhizobium lablabi]
MPQNGDNDRSRRSKSTDPPPTSPPASWPALVWSILTHPRIWPATGIGLALIGTAGMLLQAAGYDPLALIGISQTRFSEKLPKKDPPFKIAYFQRQMQIREWSDWHKGTGTETTVYDRVVHEDTIVFQPIHNTITFRDRSTVRGRIFVDYILGGKLQITNKEEYEDWSNRSIVEYQVVIPPPPDGTDSILLRRFSYENNLPREDRTPSQAGLRVPADSNTVEAILNFSLLDVKIRPTLVECRIGVPSEKGGLEERISNVERLGDPAQSIFYCGDKNLSAGSQVIFQWFWPDPAKKG